MEAYDCNIASWECGWSQRRYAICSGWDFIPLKHYVCSLILCMDPAKLLGCSDCCSSLLSAAFDILAATFPGEKKTELISVIHVQITSGLDYCNILYFGLPLKTVQTFQLFQNKSERPEQQDLSTCLWYIKTDISIFISIIKVISIFPFH